jgi:hypothetical protein
MFKLMTKFNAKAPWMALLTFASAEKAQAAAAAFAAKLKPGVQFPQYTVNAA